MSVPSVPFIARAAPPAVAVGSADGPRVHVRGTSRIDAHAARAGGKLLLSGTLVDDAARPVPGERVLLAIATKADTTHTLPIGSGVGATACSDSRDNVSALGPTLERTDTLSLKTDDGGRFCVRLSLPVDRYVAHLSFSAMGSIDATQVDLPFDLALKPLSLAFDPLPRALPLEGPPAALEVVATVDDEGASTPGVNLRLSLTNEAGASLAVGTTNGSGRARFSVTPALLGPPGRGELRIAFAGNGDMGASQYVAQIERHAKVELVVPEASGGRLTAGVPEDGVSIDVVARARTEADAASTPGGTVEARIGDAIVGAAPLEGGKAHVIVTFAPPAASQVAVRLRYAPEAPWFEAGNDIIVALPIRGPSPWRHAPVILAGLAVIAWLALGRTRARLTKDTPPESRQTSFHGEANVEVLRARPEQHGWTGHVVDAHESTPVGGARVAIERAGFAGVEVLAASETAHDGSFVLPPIEAREGDRLAVEGPFHAALQKSLPPCGDLAIGLVLRRRALLDRLVAWARRRGKPFDVTPEATPGHVRRAAGAEFPVARWADAVERAAFGGGAIDAQAEAEIDRLVPERVVAELSPGTRAAALAHDTLEDPPRKDGSDPSAPGGADPQGL